MTMAEFFLLVNTAGVRLVNVADQLQLRGSTGAISPEILAGAGEHKATILALLPLSLPDDERAEREAIAREGNSEVSPEELEAALALWPSPEEVKPVPKPPAGAQLYFLDK